MTLPDFSQSMQFKGLREQMGIEPHPGEQTLPCGHTTRSMSKARAFKGLCNECMATESDAWKEFVVKASSTPPSRRTVQQRAAIEWMIQQHS